VRISFIPRRKPSWISTWTVWPWSWSHCDVSTHSRTRSPVPADYSWTTVSKVAVWTTDLTLSYEMQQDKQTW